MKSFAYYAPSTLEEALSLMGQLKEDVKLLAGGTDLLIQMKRRLITPQTIVDLNKIHSLNYIVEDEQSLSLGSLNKISELEFSSLVKEKAGVLAQAASKLGSRQIRNIATLGGNICNGAPSAEMAPALLVLNAKAHLLGKEGKRSVSIEDFFIGPRQTIINSNEILVGFTVDKYRDNTKAVYMRSTRRKAMDIALVSVAVRIDLDEDDLTVRNARIGLGAVAPRPIRVLEAEELLKGNKLTSQLITKVGKMAVKSARPITDIRASADYRKELIYVLTERALDQISQGRQRPMDWEVS